MTMTFELAVFLIAMVPVLLRGWQGWRYGATREIRHSLMYLFGMLVALRYWYPVTDAASQWMINCNPRLLAAVVFPALFLLAVMLAALAIKFRAEYIQGVQSNRLNNLLGAILGLFSGAIIGGSLLLIVSMGLPVLMTGFDRQKFPLALEQLPLDAFREIERNIAGIPPQSASHTPLPELTAAENSASNPPAFVWD